MVAQKVLGLANPHYDFEVEESVRKATQPGSNFIQISG
jgi:hypothetical protein